MLSIINLLYIFVLVCRSAEASNEKSNLIQNKDDYCKITKDHTLCQFKVNDINQFCVYDKQYNAKDVIVQSYIQTSKIILVRKLCLTMWRSYKRKLN